VLDLCGAGMVLAGGGSRLTGLGEVCEQVLKRPIRMASPVPLSRLPVQLAEPEFATLVGLAMYAHRTTVARISQDNGLGSRLRAIWAKLGA